MYARVVSYPQGSVLEAQSDLEVGPGQACRSSANQAARASAFCGRGNRPSPSRIAWASRSVLKHRRGRPEEVPRQVAGMVLNVSPDSTSCISCSFRMGIGRFVQPSAFPISVCRVPLPCLPC